MGERGIDAQFKADLVGAIPHLRRYAYSLIGNHPSLDPDDLVQKAAERGLARAQAYEPRSSVKVWLFTILHNLCVNDVRRFQRESRRLDALGEEVQAKSASTRVAGPDGHEALWDVEVALEQLPLEQKQVILLIGVEGLCYAEVAEVLGIPVGTVRSRLSRGRETLRLGLSPPARNREAK